ncbi:hypothetical protein ETH_00029950 [Eimeria tenella]|uniref:EGF-like domain-containing protein n=1 Tax=Eimeria tenella TaxID=5802 RepID=U6L5K3_EIMTE|nr:hypothetical protein ETH_00029950 [Eimeria tenella]CDJ43889.1 hypothetical protein ETH_00029950 [Eimeria tenella]|eukprot:XP_013234638.1 hypothetical protein ETH_00029950 [Eimeria tenella]
MKRLRAAAAFAAGAAAAAANWSVDCQAAGVYTPQAPPLPPPPAAAAAAAAAAPLLAARAPAQREPQAPPPRPPPQQQLLLGAGGAAAALQRLGQLGAELAHCDPKREGVCCLLRDFCDSNADCFSDVSPENVLEWVHALPRCSCRWGFAGDGRSSGSGCSNVDECSTGAAGCEQLCFDLAPGFACGCFPGFRLLPNGKLCQDIDECSSSSSPNAGCQHVCTNLLGSFACSCLPGQLQQRRQQRQQQRRTLVVAAAAG